MQWKEIFPSSRQPSMDEIADYIGGDAKELWLSLMKYMASVYGAKPGWNVKFQKSGQSFGTLYPEENAFSVMVIISYRLDPLMRSILPDLSPATAELYNNAGDYMKMGKWIMLQIKDSAALEDYKKIMAVKLPPKVKQ